MIVSTPERMNCGIRLTSTTAFALDSGRRRPSSSTEISCFAETTQVERGASRERHGADGARRLALHELRQLIHRLFDVDRAALRDGFFAVRHDGAGRGEVRTRDARAGDDDFIDLDGFGARLGRGLPEC